MEAAVTGLEAGTGAAVVTGSEDVATGASPFFAAARALKRAMTDPSSFKESPTTGAALDGTAFGGFVGIDAILSEI